MKNRFVYLKTKNNLDYYLNNGDVDNDSIVFIEDTEEIWTHGRFYKAASWKYLYE